MSQQTRASGARILLVEDDETARISLLQLLRRAGHQVDAVIDGEAALALLDRPGRGKPYDIVLTDLLLRHADGLAVMKRARALADPPEVVLLTGYGTLNTAIEAIRLGACDYLLKPCRPEELLGCMREAWRRRDERRSHEEALATIAYGLSRLQARSAPRCPDACDCADSSLEIGALLMDREQRVAFFAGQLLTLTPTEYTLLCCLAERAGQMVSYDELARLVYNRQMPEHDAHVLLKTHIHNLRRKTAPELIVNVRAVGYRIGVVPKP